MPEDYIRPRDIIDHGAGLGVRTVGGYDARPTTGSGSYSITTAVPIAMAFRNGTLITLFQQTQITVSSNASRNFPPHPHMSQCGDAHPVTGWYPKKIDNYLISAYVEYTCNSNVSFYWSDGDSQIVVPGFYTNINYRLKDWAEIDMVRGYPRFGTLGPCAGAGGGRWRKSFKVEEFDCDENTRIADLKGVDPSRMMLYGNMRIPTATGTSTIKSGPDLTYSGSPAEPHSPMNIPTITTQNTYGFACTEYVYLYMPDRGPSLPAGARVERYSLPGQGERIAMGYARMAMSAIPTSSMYGLINGDVQHGYPEIHGVQFPSQGGIISLSGSNMSVKANMRPNYPPSISFPETLADFVREQAVLDYPPGEMLAKPIPALGVPHPPYKVPATPPP